MKTNTIHRMFRQTVENHGDRPALSTKAGSDYRSVTYADLWQRVLGFRRALSSLGLAKEDRLAILSYNREEWTIADLTAQSLGAITVPIYHTLPAQQVAFYVADSGAAILIVEDEKQLSKALEVRGLMPSLQHIILMKGPRRDGILSFEDAMQLGSQSNVTEAQLDAIEETITPDDTATFIYTSGTTGNPKGAMLSHRALLHTTYAAQEVVRLDETDTFLSFLPLCHVVERVGGHYLPLSIGANIVFSEGPFAVANEIATVRPTIFLCVPRMYETVQERVGDAVAKMPPLRRRVFGWAMSVGRSFSEATLSGRRPSILLALQRRLADKLVLGQLRQKASGGRARFFVSGGAPLNVGTARFYEAMGVRMLEGYGLTECPVITLNLPDRSRIGTVGPTLPGLEVTLAPDGEILARGPSLMKGYYERPDATAEAIDESGWFHTGDIGKISSDGFVSITDRKKDILVLANGKNVAPQPIEAAIKQSPFISEIVLIGDKQNVLTALVIPALERVKAWARDQGIAVAGDRELVEHPDVRRLLKSEIDAHSTELADYERVKRFTLLDHGFSIETGELTPTLKVKRRVVAEKYAEQIAMMNR